MAELQPKVTRLEPQPEIAREIQAEVADEATPLFSFVLRHARVIAGGLVLTVAGFSAAGIWHWYDGRKIQQAEIEIGRILILEDDASRLERLEQLLSSVPSSLRIGLLLEAAGSAVRSGKTERAAELYGMVQDADPRGAAGMSAGLTRTDLLRALGRSQEAFLLLKALSEIVPADRRASVRASLAACAEECGRDAEALEIYTALASDPKLQDSAFLQSRITALTQKLSSLR